RRARAISRSRSRCRCCFSSSSSGSTGRSRPCSSGAYGELVKRVAAIATFLLLATAAAVHAQEVTLSVAISMKDAVEGLGRGFMAARPGVKLRYNFGSSGELQKQIEAGAPVGPFIPAGQRPIARLRQQRH